MKKHRNKREVSADAMAVAIRRSGKYEFDVEEYTRERVEIVFFRIATDGERVRLGSLDWTIEDAKTARLDHQDTYKKHMRRMLWCRAMSEGYRSFCPDATADQLYVEGELERPHPWVGEKTEQADPVPATDEQLMAIRELLEAAAVFDPDVQKNMLAHLFPDQTDPTLDDIDQHRADIAVAGLRAKINRQQQGVTS